MPDLPEEAWEAARLSWNETAKPPYLPPMNIAERFRRALNDAAPAIRQQVREPVAKAVDRMAGPLGRARSRALDGVSDADQIRDLDLVADGVKELRAALEDSDA